MTTWTRRRPRIEPNGMGAERKLTGKRGRRRRRGKITPKVIIEEQILKMHVPVDSRFKGYEYFG